MVGLVESLKWLAGTYVWFWSYWIYVALAITFVMAFISQFNDPLNEKAYEKNV